MSADNDEDYTHLLVMDLQRRPNYPTVQCVSITNSGIRSVHKGRIKLSRNFRLRPLHLPIYGDERHMYNVIAKCHKFCTSEDRNRATSALNDFVTNALKTHMTLDAIVAAIVEVFPCRVLRNKDFSSQNAPLTKYATKSARFKDLSVMSSSETDQFATTDHNDHDDEPFKELHKTFPQKRG